MSEADDIDKQFPILERWIPGRLGTNINVVRKVRKSLCVEGTDFITHKKKLRHTEASVAKINAHILSPDSMAQEKAPPASGAPSPVSGASDTPDVVEEGWRLIVAQKKAPVQAIAYLVKKCANPRIIQCVLEGGNPQKSADWINVRVPHARTIIHRLRDGTRFPLPVVQVRGSSWDLLGPPPPRVGDWCGKEHPFLIQHSTQ